MTILDELSNMKYLIFILLSRIAHSLRAHSNALNALEHYTSILYSIDQIFYLFHDFGGEGCIYIFSNIV